MMTYCSNCQIVLPETTFGGSDSDKDGDETGNASKTVISTWRELLDGENVLPRRLISINLALSLIFEASPLKLTSFQKEEGEKDEEDFIDKDSHFICGSQGYLLCSNCSDLLTTLYNSFRRFLAVCKLNSKVGNALRKLSKPSKLVHGEEEETCENEEENNENGTDNRSEGSDDDAFIKVEPDEYDDNLNEDGDSEYIEERSNFNSPLGSPLGSSSPSSGIIKHEPEESSPLTDDHHEDTQWFLEEGEIAPSTQKQNFKSHGSETRSFSEPVQEGNYKMKLRERRVVQQVNVNSQNSLKCGNCGKQFLFETTLICHRRLIHKEKVFLQIPPTFITQINQSDTNANDPADQKTSTQCLICRKRVPKLEIQNHLSSHIRSQRKPWLCTICGKECQDETAYYKHCKVHSGSLVPCNYCGTDISRQEMFMHMKTSCNKAKLHFCNPQQFWKSAKLQYIYKLRLAMMVLKSKRKFSCKLCGVGFTFRKDMLTHMNTLHMQPKNYNCMICNRRFDRVDVLRQHTKRFHHSPIKYIPKRPKSSEPKTMFTTGEHDSTEPRYGCKACLSKFYKSKELNDHMLESHSQLETLTCNVCHKKLKDKYCLQIHLSRLHSELKEIQCHLCSKTYRRNEALAVHLEGEHGLDKDAILSKYPNMYTTRRRRRRPAQSQGRPKRVNQQELTLEQQTQNKTCEICEKTFNSVYDKKKHVRIVHKQIREFMCIHCGKKFSKKAYLKIHETLHVSTERPFKCHLCGKDFRVSRNLYAHLKSSIHNSEKNVICELCGKAFTRRTYMRNHMRSVHMNIPLRKPKALQKPYIITETGARVRYWPTATEAGSSETADNLGTSTSPIPSSSDYHQNHNQPYSNW